MLEEVKLRALLRVGMVYCHIFIPFYPIFESSFGSGSMSRRQCQTGKSMFTRLINCLVRTEKRKNAYTHTFKMYRVVRF